jgi:hypothetical protein
MYIVVVLVVVVVVLEWCDSGLGLKQEEDVAHGQHVKGHFLLHA